MDFMARCAGQVAAIQGVADLFGAVDDAGCSTIVGVYFYGGGGRRHACNKVVAGVDNLAGTVIAQ